jgi:hypothetical protein
MRPRHHLLTLALLVAACGDGEGQVPVVDTTLTVLNRSQFELLELYVHELESYDEAENLLVAPLAPDAELVVDFTTYWFVTVVRLKIAVGDPIAVTTAEGLEVGAEGFTLIVFDESFRLMDPGSDF